MKYRPSNGTEGDFFMDRFCFRCVHDDEEAGVWCPIVGASMIYDVDDEEYPSEWVRNDDGIGGYCTAFERATE